MGLTGSQFEQVNKQETAIWVCRDTQGMKQAVVGHTSLRGRMETSMTAFKRL